MDALIALLGFLIVTDPRAWCFGVPEQRLSKVRATARAVLDEIDLRSSCVARHLARLAGQVLSMQTAPAQARAEIELLAGCLEHLSHMGGSLIQLKKRSAE